MDPKHVVEVFGPSSYGSGYRVGGALVLTAGHLAGGDRTAAFRVRAPDGGSADAVVRGLGTGVDVAVLEVREAGPPVQPTTLGRLRLHAPGPVPFQMAGWPRAASVRDDSGVWERELVQVYGEIRPAEHAAARGSIVRLRPSDQYPPFEEGSFWEGMSGAAVFVDERLVGVQVGQPRADITNYLAAQELAAEHDELDDLAGLFAAAGVRLEPALDPSSALLREYLRAVEHEAAQPPGWFPQRLLERDDVVRRLSQEPELEIAGNGGWAAVGSLREAVGNLSAVVLDGEAGAGKTWCLAAFGRELAEMSEDALAGDGRPMRLPAVCRLSDIDERDTLADILSRAIDSTGFDAREVAAARARLDIEGRWALIVDGVDEATPEQKAAVGRAVDRALAGDEVVGLIALGTRPGELEIRPHHALGAVRINAFGPRKQAAFIDAWFEGANSATAHDRVRVLTDHWQVAEAFHSPLVLSLACVAVEQDRADQPVLRNSADIFRASATTLVDNAHRSPRLRSSAGIAERRMRRRIVETLTDLASRLFRTGTYVPSLPEDALDDVDTDVLEACVDTGLVTLRADGGVDFGNRSLATYLAAQWFAGAETWPDVMATVWEDRALMQLVAFVPHALLTPLQGEPRPEALGRWTSTADALMAGGDPAFLLLHTACRALAFLPPETPAEAWRQDRVSDLVAHLHSGVDPRALDSLATLAPDELARMGPDVQSASTFDVAIDLANVGHDRGFEMLSRVLRSDDDDIHVRPALLEWLGRRGDSRGMRLVEAAVAAGDPFHRALAALVLLRWRAGGAADLAAPLLDDADVPESLRTLVAGALHARGDARGTEALHVLASSASADVRLRSVLWLAGDAPPPADELRAIADRAEGAVLLATLGALADEDPGTAAARLEALARPATAPTEWSEPEAAAVAAARLLAVLDAERGAAALSALAAQPYQTGLAAAAVAYDADAELGVQLLSAYARNAESRADWRAVAGRVLEFHGRPEAGPLLAQVAASGEDGENAVRFAAPKSAFISAAYETSVVLGEAHELTLDPETALDSVVDALRGISVVQPSDGVPRDSTDAIMTDFGADAGTAPALAPQFDLSVARDRHALAMAIPLMDVPGDRTYLMNYGAATAPSNDWIELMAGWAVGDFADSPRAEHLPTPTDWAAAAEKLFQIGPGLLEWAAAAWGDPGWIVNRCLPLVLDHATTVVALEMSHRVATPAPPVIVRGLNGLSPLPGLSEPATRACVGRICARGLAAALDASGDAGIAAVRDRYAARAAALECAHAARP